MSDVPRSTSDPTRNPASPLPPAPAEAPAQATAPFDSSSLTLAIDAQPTLSSSRGGGGRRSLDERYEILREVARGGMGVVYLAHHKALGRSVAVKVLQPGESDARFVREARVLAAIRSPHVVAVHDLEYLSDDSLMLVMDWIDGGDLKTKLQQSGGRIDEPQALGWMRDTCEGMLAAEEVGVVHRDLKPSNILIDNHSRALVADFGLARRADGIDDLTSAETTMGTPYYMAPEQADDPRQTDVRSDIYSFGATFYHLLTGRPPFDGPTHFSVLFKHKTEPLISPQSVHPGLSNQASEVLERCLAKSPKDRFQSFADVLKHCRASSSSAWDSVEADMLPYVARFQERRDVYLFEPAALGEGDEYDFGNGRRLRILAGNMAGQQVDAVVSSDDERLSMRGGVSLALLKASGERLRQEAQRFVPVRPGRAVVTSGGDLPARFVLHGVTMTLVDERNIRPSRDLIQEILASCFYHADTLHVERIAFPLLGTGTAGFSKEICLDLMFRYLCKTLLNGLTCVREARIVLWDGRPS